MDDIEKWIELVEKLLKEWEEQQEPESIKWDKSWGELSI
jgi:hypothetical protein